MKILWSETFKYLGYQPKVDGELLYETRQEYLDRNHAPENRWWSGEITPLLRMEWEEL